MLTSSKVTSINKETKKKVEYGALGEADLQENEVFPSPHCHIGYPPLILGFTVDAAKWLDQSLVGRQEEAGSVSISVPELFTGAVY